MSMEEIANRIKYLSRIYPKWIKLYPGVTSEALDEFEKRVSFKLDEQLKELYSFTNGFGIVDYSLLGINNKKIYGLAQEWMSRESKDALRIISTSGNEGFGYFLNQSIKEHIVYYDMYDIYGDHHRINVAHSIKDFFSIFLNKVEVLLYHIRDDDVVLYFDDPKLPLELNSWNPI